ncbi:hypothetical protein F8M41_007675 [Gigaspora margarita]|uniref:Uncharacterized protein n=1 Tax=Gigaspora margarita TaxID=4874 RepID=A0A8H3X4Q8_GIGMA|nr:hypothetical protein F8M41_007675 [Gigaspora margarita]
MHFTDSPKLDLYFSIDKKGEHQSDAYWVLGLIVHYAEKIICVWISVKDFSCKTDERPGAKCKVIKDLLLDLVKVLSGSEENEKIFFVKMLSKEKCKEVINKLTMHFIDSPKLDLYFSIDKEGPGIPLDEVLKAYPENAVPNQPIVWNHTLKFPDKSIAVWKHDCRLREPLLRNR